MTPDEGTAARSKWRTMLLGDVLERTAKPVHVESGEFYREIGIRSHGKGIFHKEPTRGTTLGSKRVFEVEPGRLVFNIVFAWEGAVATTSERERGMIASHRFPMFAPTSENLVDIEFLRRFFQTEYGVRLLGEASPGGAGRNRTLNQKFTAEIPLPVPPLPEQKKIASILSSVDDAIEATQAVIGQLGVVKKAMMAELLTRGLPGRHKKFKMTEIGEVPEEWEVRTIDSVLESCTYGVNCRLSPDPSSGTPVLRMSNIDRDRLNLSELKYANLDAFPHDKVALRRGDLLFNRTNSADLVGKVALVDTNAKLSYASYLLRLRTKERLASTAWLFYRLAAPDLQGELRGLATKGVSQSNINPTRMRATLIAVPSTDEQSAIVHALEAVDERAGSELSRVQQLRTLKQAVMSVLLTGEVRVRPDEAAA